MIAGLGAAIFCFLLIAMVLISILLRRRNRCQKAHKNQWSNGTTSRNEVNSDLLYDYLDSLTSNNSHQALLTGKEFRSELSHLGKDVMIVNFDDRDV